MNYRAYGTSLASTVHLPELAPSSPEPVPALSFTSTDRAMAIDGWRWLRAPTERACEPWLAIAAGHGGYRLQFEGAADFFVSADGRRIESDATSADGDASVRHLLIDQVVPLALSHQGKFVLHGSAVVVGDGAAAFIGPTGAGKSTVAASFALAGSRLISDDALVLEPNGDAWTAVPAYAGVRLWPDVLRSMPPLRRDQLPPVGAYTEKRRIGRREGIVFQESALPLKRIYLLRRSTRAPTGVEALSGRDGAVALIHHSYLLDIGDERRLRDHFARACDASRLAMRVLTYRDDLSALDAVRAAVASDLAA